MGGPRRKGEECERTSECGFALRCTRDGVCEDTCWRGETCATEGLICDHAACVVSAPAGTPCARDWQCNEDLRCRANALYTCRAACGHDLRCPDGSECSVIGADCPLTHTPVAVDLCERTATGSIGCREDEACVLTTVGVRRCMYAGCEPGASATVCGGACLPDPENPSVHVCWLGGPTPLGAPCENSYECMSRHACNDAGLCAPVCETEGARCRGSGPGHVCRNFVCTPEDP